MKKIKKNWKKIISLALVAIIGTFTLGSLTTFAIRDTKTISATEFSRGTLDDKGVHVPSKQSLYTKEAFGCKGLCVEPDFEFHGTYDVYYYDANDKFLKSDKGIVGNYTADKEFNLAKYARIVIHPDISANEDADEYKIGYFEVYGIASDVKITVDKDQNYLYQDSVNLYKNASSNGENKTSENIFVFGENGEAVYKKYDIYVSFGEASSVDFINSAGVKVFASDNFYSEDTFSNWKKFSVTVLDDSIFESFTVKIPSSSECYIFGYNG